MAEEKVKWYEFVWRNTLGSKTTIGVVMMVTSPLTGPLAPGVLAAGKLLTAVGVADKAVKNRAEIGALIGGAISALWKSKKEKK